MVRPGRERLSGRVEVDETWIGGVEKGTHGRDSETKSLVAIAVGIKHPKGFGRVRMQRVAGVPQLVGIFVDAGSRFACKSRGDVVAGGQML